MQIGIDWGGIKIKSGAMALDGCLSQSLRFDTPPDDRSGCIAKMVKIIALKPKDDPTARGLVAVMSTLDPGPCATRGGKPTMDELCTRSTVFNTPLLRRAFGDTAGPRGAALDRR